MFPDAPCVLVGEACVMSNAWGHTLRRLTDDERWNRFVIGGRAVSERRQCASCRGEKSPADWLATYNYVTGRAGRVSWARRYLCDRHADAFRRRHGAAEIDGPVPRHMLDRLTRLPAGEP